jgi:carboxylesterase type B
VTAIIGKMPGHKDTPTVRTSTGVISGRHENGLDVFLGIPFAEPPVGDLRFAAPRPASSWTGVRDAAQFGPPPPQDVGAFRDRLPPDYDPVAGERGRQGDWLTVNVWTPPASARPPRPVMVWIYGGAYKVGSADSPGYDAQRIARGGDAVVVTFNHRVGIEGFAVIDGAPANRGLLDQVAALEWVRDNIAAFGGDPRAVTVFGESAGAGCVSITEEEASRALSVFGPGQDGRKYRDAFPGATAEELYVQVHTDWLFRMPALQLAETQTAGGGRVYLYELAWEAPGANGLLGACHGLDLPLLFGTFGASLGPLLFGPEPSEKAYAAAAQLRETWTTFAASGSPGWPAYDSVHRTTQIFDEVTTIAAYPENQSRLLWQEFPFSTLPLLEG